MSTAAGTASLALRARYAVPALPFNAKTTLGSHTGWTEEGGPVRTVLATDRSSLEGSAPESRPQLPKNAKSV